MCSSSSPPKPPDYTPIAAASKEAAEIAYKAASEDLAFRKQVHEESKPREEQLRRLAERVVDQQMGIADKNVARADEQWQQYQDTYLPNELQTIADSYGASYLSSADNALLTEIISGRSGMAPADAQAALNRLSQKAQERAAQQAMTQAGADVNNVYGQALRTMTRFGGDPNRLASAAAKLSQNAALAKVGASNQAREQARGQLLGLRSGVANFGRNMPNTAGQAFGLATQAGNSAMSNQNAAFMSGLPYAQFAAGGYGSQMGAAGLAQQGALGMGGLMNQGYANQLNAWSAAQNANAGGLAGLGNMVGMLGSAYLMAPSDRAVKENIELLETRPDGIGVYSFEFKPEYKDRFGAGRYVGVMADEVERVIPDAVMTGEDGIKRVNYALLQE